MMLKLKAAGRYGDLKLAIQQAEVDELWRLKEEYGDGSGNCFNASPSSVTPLPVAYAAVHRSDPELDWPLASELATTLEERQDIEDSIMRVDDMLKLKAAGRFDEALAAVLKKEAEDISEARSWPARRGRPSLRQAAPVHGAALTRRRGARRRPDVSCLVDADGRHP